MITTYPTWIEIDTSAIRENCEKIIRDLKTPLMTILKGNGYGHGAVPSARAALAGGASWLSVARFSEAMSLRQAGIAAPILVLGMVTPEEVDAAIVNQVSLTLYSPEAMQMYLERVRAVKQTLKVHLKIDTGLGRLGILPEDTVDLACRLFNENQNQRDSIVVEGIFSHLSKSDSPADPLNELQQQRFARTLNAYHAAWQRFNNPVILANENYPYWVHLANSAGAFYLEQTRYNLMRIGNVCLGLRIRIDEPLAEGYKPALRWKARLASCRKLPRGWGVGYGATHQSDGNRWIGVVPVGFGDGLRQLPGNRVLIGGYCLPVVGRLSLDQMMVELPTYFPPGEEVVIVGEQAGQSIWVHDIAKIYGISQVDFTTLIHQRVPRVDL